MKSMAVLMIAGMSLLFIGNSVNAWGGIYNNRFSPEMIQNMGYGSPHRIYQEVGHILNIKVILTLSVFNVKWTLFDLKERKTTPSQCGQIDLFLYVLLLLIMDSRIASIVL